MQAYHCTLQEAMTLTLPQMMMLNHAAGCNYERQKRRMESQKEKNTRSVKRIPETAEHNGKPVEDLNSDEFSNYLGDFFKAGTG